MTNVDTKNLDKNSPEYREAEKLWSQGLLYSLPFEVGKNYTRYDGAIVTCIEIGAHGDSAQFNDYTIHDGRKLGWRYNRPSDRGRSTGGRFDSDMNVHPEFHIPDLSEQTSDYKQLVEVLKSIRNYMYYIPHVPVKPTYVSIPAYFYDTITKLLKEQKQIS